MRVLFTFVGGRGHFEPLRAIACAAEAAGHDIAFGCAPRMVSTVEAAGFEVFAMGTDLGGPLKRLPLRPFDREREDRDLRERFARRAAGYRVPLTVELCREWQPDVLVCDETDFGAMVAAECLGLVFATVLVIATGSFVRAQVVGVPLDELRAEHGLPPDPELAMLGRYLVLSPFPPGYRDPACPLPVTAHSIRPSRPGPVTGSAPQSSSLRPGAPTVYFTLGTVFNTECGDLFARVLAGLRDLPINLIATLGPGIDVQEFVPQPANIRIENYIPQWSLLPHCDLVVCHGGSGSVMGALAHGLPSLLIPLGADQAENADRCVGLGVGQVLDALRVTPESVRLAVETLLGTPSYRRRAQRLRDEIAALPGPDYAIGLLERLAREKQPIPST
ncbi:MAG: glycosyltransferase [bacterium]|nr:glycosyltransferase [bacterium]